MAEKKTTTQQEAPVVAAVFSKEDLIESAAVLGTTGPVMAGALYSVEKEMLTREEAKKAVDTFLKKPVEKGEK